MLIDPQLREKFPAKLGWNQSTREHMSRKAPQGPELSEIVWPRKDVVLSQEQAYARVVSFGVPRPPIMHPIFWDGQRILELPYARIRLHFQTALILESLLKHIEGYTTIDELTEIVWGEELDGGILDTRRSIYVRLTVLRRLLENTNWGIVSIHKQIGLFRKKGGGRRRSQFRYA